MPPVAVRGYRVLCGAAAALLAPTSSQSDRPGGIVAPEVAAVGTELTPGGCVRRFPADG